MKCASPKFSMLVADHLGIVRGVPWLCGTRFEDLSSVNNDWKVFLLLRNKYTMFSLRKHKRHHFCVCCTVTSKYIPNDAAACLGNPVLECRSQNPLSSRSSLPPAVEENFSVDSQHRPRSLTSVSFQIYNYYHVMYGSVSKWNMDDPLCSDKTNLRTNGIVRWA